MLRKPLYSLLVLLLFHFSALAQNSAILKGKVTTKKGNTVEGVKITTSNNRTGVITDSTGIYQLSIPANIDVILSITHISYEGQQWKVNLDSGETREFNIKMKGSNYTIPEVEVKGE